MPSAGQCAGEEFAAFAGMGILSSYLLLFISFYAATYRKDHQKGGRGRKKARRLSETATKATISMSKMEVPDARNIGEKMHIVDQGKSNGAVTNGGVTPRITRSKKA